MSVAPIALTCGEPAGVGPELAEWAWEALGATIPFFLIGDATHLPGRVPIVRISDPDEAKAAAVTGLPVLHRDFGGAATPGIPDPANAKDVMQAIADAVALTLSGSASAVCTAPINKKALKDGADFAFPGHTEFLAHLTGVDRVVMMLASAELRVVPATIHIPLSKVPDALTPELLRATIGITAAGLRDRFGIAEPRIAVAGLNPHAGEGGVMGHEDAALIEPIVEEFMAAGLDIVGPLPADTMFHATARRRYDAAIAMYHDQALIPIKTLDFDRGVNVTLGLPVVRTSPDHGTAFDIAGQGVANPTSLIEALKLAHSMACGSSGAA